MKKKRIGIQHKYITTKIMDKCGKKESSFVIDRNNFRYYLSCFAIPKYLHQKYIDEMQGLGLIKVMNKNTIMVYKQEEDED